MPKIFNPAEIRAYLNQRVAPGTLRKKFRFSRGGNRDTLLNTAASEAASSEESQREEDIRRYPHRKTASDIADQVLIKVAESFSPQEMDVIQRYMNAQQQPQQQQNPYEPQQLPVPPSAENSTYPEGTPEMPEPSYEQAGPPISSHPAMSEARPGREDMQMGTQPTATSTLPMASLEGEPALDPKMLLKNKVLRRLL